MDQMECGMCNGMGTRLVKIIPKRTPANLATRTWDNLDGLLAVLILCNSVERVRCCDCNGTGILNRGGLTPSP